MTKPAAHIQCKRIYETAVENDALRVLVDRLWPRGVSKHNAKIDIWAKEIAPSTELRQWYGHAPERWPEFAERYRAELDRNVEQINALREQISGRTVTLVYAAPTTGRNNVDVLQSYLKED